MVYNERQFLPIWLHHYGSAIGYENLYIIDDGSTDGSTSDIRKNLINKRRVALDEEDRAALISYFHEELLDYYDIVIYTDCDEIIAIDPALNVNLKKYLCSHDYEVKRVFAFEVLHRVSAEPQLNFDQPLFKQRSFVRFQPWYCKTSISKSPIRWQSGFHRSNKQSCIDANLLMFHLRSVDYNFSINRIAFLNDIEFSSNSLHNNHNFQFRMSAPEYMKHLYSTSEEEFDNAYTGELADACLKEDEIGMTDVICIPSRFHSSIELGKFSKEVELMNVGRRTISSSRLEKMFSKAMFRTIWSRRNRAPEEQCPCGSGKQYRHCHGVIWHRTSKARRIISGLINLVGSR